MQTTPKLSAWRVSECIEYLSFTMSSEEKRKGTKINPGVYLTPKEAIVPHHCLAWISNSASSLKPQGQVSRLNLQKAINYLKCGCCLVNAAGRAKSAFFIMKSRCIIGLKILYSSKLHLMLLLPIAFLILHCQPYIQPRKGFGNITLVAMQVDGTNWTPKGKLILCFF